MKKLITKFSLFILLLGSIIVLSFIVISKIIIEKASFKLHKPVGSIVLGNSHTEFALNDSIITDFTNISQSGESYFYTYVKLKEMVKDNPEIETVFLAFSNEVIDVGMDEWTWGDQYISYRFPKFAPFMDFHHHYILAYNNPKSYIENLSKSIKKNSGKILSNDYRFINHHIGPFKNLNQIVEDPEETKEKPSQMIKVELSPVNLAYLDKIVSFCHEKRINLLFIRCPLHPKYTGYYNESELKHLLKTRYSTIQFLDFANFPLESADYFDLEHLNFNGSKKFSLWFETFKNTELQTKMNN
jgi:hypothetical protein